MIEDFGYVRQFLLLLWFNPEMEHSYLEPVALSEQTERYHNEKRVIYRDRLCQCRINQQ